MVRDAACLCSDECLEDRSFLFGSDDAVADVLSSRETVVRRLQDTSGGPQYSNVCLRYLDS